MSEFLEKLKVIHKDDWARSEVIEHISNLEHLAEIKNPACTNSLVHGRLMLDFDLKRCYSDGVLVELTNLQFRLVAYFMRHAGEVCPVRHIMKEVWGNAYDESSAQYLRVCLASVREKLGADVVLTHRGFGYIMP